MKRKTKDKLETLSYILLMSIPVLLILGLIGLEIYCWVTYGNDSISDTPNWVQWIMFRRS